ncbi:MAG: lipoyl synthase [Nitrospirae bacterium]|nr:lipoyl synthase [Nitrospirota bacterium]
MSELIQITHGPTRRGKRPPQVAEPATRPSLPPWIRVRLRQGQDLARLRGLLRGATLHTVCEEARCPNLWECWNRGTATFMILGDICTRSCGFCAVKTGRPLAVDRDEPRRVAEAVRAMGLTHAVVTSVNRDELPDGGASVFAETIRAIRAINPRCAVEVLIPDFQGSEAALLTVLDAKPDILNHNTETVPRLYPTVRPQARYERSLALLAGAKTHGARVKTGLMVGLGETAEELLVVFTDLRGAGCDILTLGQYLQPTREHVPVDRYYSPEEFERLREEALALGVAHVEAGPLVRSSYHADAQAAAALRLAPGPERDPR